MTRNDCCCRRLVLAGQPATRRRPEAAAGTIERLDPRFDELIAKDAKLEKLADGFAWTEGPVWVKKGGYLLFSDIPNNAVMQVAGRQEASASSSSRPATPASAPTSCEPGSNGLLLDPEGRLVLMRARRPPRRPARTKDGKTTTTLADKYEGKRLNSPNDGVFAIERRPLLHRPAVRPDAQGQAEDFPDRELDFQRRLSAVEGRQADAADQGDDASPTASPSRRTRRRCTSPTPTRRRRSGWRSRSRRTARWARARCSSTRRSGSRQEDQGLPDGLKVDTKGNLFATGPGGVLVFAPDGKHLGTHRHRRATPATAASATTASTLYVMRDKAIGRIKTATQGPNR